MRNIKTKTAERVIRNTLGTIFAVTFTKANGTVRTLTGRLHVTKGLTGQGLSYDPSTRGLIPVYDMAKGAYRMVSLNTVRSVAAHGRTYRVNR